jgi:hypothetical protein
VVFLRELRTRWRLRTGWPTGLGGDLVLWRHGFWLRLGRIGWISEFEAVDGCFSSRRSFCIAKCE